MTLTGRHLIAGQWHENQSPAFYAVNPRTKQNNETIFSDATIEQVNIAVEKAAAAFEETRLYSAEKLALFLDTVADEIEALADELINVCDSETALGIPRLTGERGRTTNQARAFAQHIREGSYVDAIIDTAQPDRQPNPRVDIRQMKIPLGVVAVFAPNNFPLAFGVAGGDTMSAFAAGCPVVAKGHPSHPGTSELVAIAIYSAIEKCGFPEGFFSLLQGTSIEVGQTLVQHPKLSAVGFTGSLRGGRAIYDTAASRPVPIPVYAEMGSINPIIILPDAINTRHDELVTGLTGSVTLGAGQFCTNPGLTIVLDTPGTNQFIEDFAAAMKAKDPQTLLNAGVESGLQYGVENLTLKDAVHVLTGGEVIDNEGYCFQNTVLKTSAGNFMTNETLHQELFGPVTLFVVCKNIVEVEAVIKSLEGNLTATIHASDTELDTCNNLFALLREKAGRLILNGFPTGVEVVHAMVHGGPYPASTFSGTTSVGMTAIQRFMRPVAFQNMPDSLLPDALKNANPLGIWRIVDNVRTKEPISN